MQVVVALSQPSFPSLHSSMSKGNCGNRLAHEQSIISSESLADHVVGSRAMKWMNELDPGERCVFCLFCLKGELL